MSSSSSTGCGAASSTSADEMTTGGGVATSASGSSAGRERRVPELLEHGVEARARLRVVGLALEQAPQVIGGALEQAVLHEDLGLREDARRLLRAGAA